MRRLRDRLRQLNDGIALGAVAVLSSMSCAWAVLALTLLPLGWPSALAVVSFVSSGVFQAVALPLLGKGQALQTAEAARLAQMAEARAVEQHRAVMETLADVREMVTDLRRIMDEQRQESAALARIEVALCPRGIPDLVG